MEYNTQLPKLKLPEYGRNIQMMVEHILTLENRDERTRAANTVIQVMGSLNPSLRENRDFKHKLWDHIQIIADLQLDIDAPYDPPTLEQLQSRPAKVPYPQRDARSEHYGKIVHQLIKKALDLPESEKKEEFVKAIANHMKLSYLTWNKDSVTDELIITSLKTMSNGQLVLPPDTKLIEIKEVPHKQVQVKKRKGGRNDRRK